jgi:calcium-dependent protein kinase
MERLTPNHFVQEANTFLEDNYRIGNLIGEGSYGKVYRVTHKLTGDIRALKVFLKRSSRVQSLSRSFFNEVSVLRALEHPCAVKVHEYYQDARRYCLITEHCTGGDLFERVSQRGCLSEGVSANYLLQLLSLLAYCHERGIVHRDIKPENLMLTSSDNLKVIDFGSATFIEPGQMLSEKVGTSYYVAPEVAQTEPLYNEKCDLWSAGVNLYILLCGYPPFNGRTDSAIMRDVVQSEFEFPSPEWDEVSDEAKDLVRQLLNKDPEARISARQALEHPWLQKAEHRELEPDLAANVFSNLRSFHIDRQLQQATLTFITSQLSTRKEREALEEVFRQLDTDKNGALSRQELIDGFLLIYDTSLEEITAEVDRIMEKVDTDHSGQIDYNEFAIAAINRQKLVSKSRIEAAFKAFDTDKSGGISVGEVKAMLRIEGISDSEVQEWMREFDVNGDGMIDRGEFIRMMTALL